MRELYTTLLIAGLAVVALVLTHPSSSDSSPFNIPQVTGNGSSDEEPKDPELLNPSGDKSSDDFDYQQKVLSDQNINDLARMKSLTGNGGNKAVIVQKGKSNKSSVTQSGKDNYAKQKQDGEDNDLQVEQNGDNNVSEEQQDGTKNRKKIIQNGKVRETSD